jgi:hypothetical protein
LGRNNATESGLEIGLPEPSKSALNGFQDFIDGKATSRRPTGRRPFAKVAEVLRQYLCTVTFELTISRYRAVNHIEGCIHSARVQYTNHLKALPISLDVLFFYFCNCLPCREYERLLNDVREGELRVNSLI